ncbi:hypothetical protein CGRA01v4_14226 [Colletotrichum graminicola]|nr:hypothetical protein CGRA01v4_14226 [Colletotrichum graminicola]
MIPEVIAHPMVLLPEEEEESWRSPPPSAIVLLLNLPQFLIPLLFGYNLHLIFAHVDRLPHTVPAFQELGCDIGCLGPKAEHGANEPPERHCRPQVKKPLSYNMRRLVEEGCRAEDLELLSTRRLGYVRHSGEEEHAGLQLEMRRTRGVPHMAVEYLKSDIATHRVTRQNDKVIRLALLARCIARRVCPSQRCQMTIDKLNLAFNVIWRVVTAEGLVTIIAKAKEVAPVDVDVAISPIYAGLERFEEVGVVIHEPWVAGNEEQEAVSGHICGGCTLWQGLLATLHGLHGLYRLCDRYPTSSEVEGAWKTTGGGQEMFE